MGAEADFILRRLCGSEAPFFHEAEAAAVTWPDRPFTDYGGIEAYDIVVGRLGFAPRRDSRGSYRHRSGNKIERRTRAPALWFLADAVLRFADRGWDTGSAGFLLHVFQLLFGVV
jgi:hypothetical protein